MEESMTNLGISALFWLAVNAYHEARGETDEGIKAVCQVVMNRADAQGRRVEDIVLAPLQFSWANGGKRPALADYAALERCLRLAYEAGKERRDGERLGGADHYYAPAGMPGGKAPSWAKDMVQVAKIGGHIFLRSR